MRRYTLCKRTSTKKDRNGNKRTWTSETYYISYYENRERVWFDTETKDLEEAQKIYEQKVEEFECRTVYIFLKAHGWLSDTKNPLYVDSNSGSIRYHLKYAHSHKNARYLQIILEELKDPIRDINFKSLNRNDVQKFKDRLTELKTYTDGHGCKREVTYTFRNNVLSAFSTIWSYYLKTGKAGIQDNPFLKVDKFVKTKPVKKKYIFTPEDYRDIFNREIINGVIPQSYYKTKHDGSLKKLTFEKWKEVTSDLWLDFFELIFLTGMRGGEAAALCVNSFPPEYDGYVVNIDRAFKSGLRKEDVNSPSSEVEVIGKPKTNEIRKIVLCDRARDITQKYMRDKSGDDLLFTLPSVRGENKYSTYLLSQKRSFAFHLFINEMNLSLGLTDNDDKALSLHGARTSLNTNLLGLKKHNEWLIAYALGWTSHALTNTQRKHYTDYSIQELADLARDINLLYLKKEFKWLPKPIKIQNSSRQARVSILLKRSEKKHWIERLVKNAKWLYRTEEKIEDIEEFLALPQEELETKKGNYYIGIINTFLKENLRLNRDELEDLKSSYDFSWDRV